MRHPGVPSARARKRGPAQDLFARTPNSSTPKKPPQAQKNVARAWPQKRNGKDKGGQSVVRILGKSRLLPTYSPRKDQDTTSWQLGIPRYRQSTCMIGSIKLSRPGKENLRRRESAESAANPRCHKAGAMSWIDRFGKTQNCACGFFCLCVFLLCEHVCVCVCACARAFSEPVCPTV